MNFQIKNRFTGSVIFECELSDKIAALNYKFHLVFAVQKATEANVNLRHASLPGADFSGANLPGVDLSGAYLPDANFSCTNLQGANFSGAYLVGANFSDANFSDVIFSGANLSGAKWANGITIQRCPLQVFGLYYPITILDHHMRIGCETHHLSEWKTFDNRRILEMDGEDAVRFWKSHKTALLALAASDGRGVNPVETESDEECPESFSKLLASFKLILADLVSECLKMRNEIDIIKKQRENW